MRTVVKVAPASVRAALSEHIGRPLESTLWSICKADDRRAITFFVFADHGGICRAYFRKNGKFAFACVGKTKDSTVARALLVIGANHAPQPDEGAPVPSVKRACGSCRWFDPNFAPDPDPAEALGLCLWPVERLPFSLRMANRERSAVGPLDGAKCATYEVCRHAPE